MCAPRQLHTAVAWLYPWTHLDHVVASCSRLAASMEPHAYHNETETSFGCAMQPQCMFWWHNKQFARTQGSTKSWLAARL